MRSIWSSVRVDICFLFLFILVLSTDLIANHCELSYSYYYLICFHIPQPQIRQTLSKWLLERNTRGENTLQTIIFPCGLYTTIIFFRYTQQKSHINSTKSVRLDLCVWRRGVMNGSKTFDWENVVDSLIIVFQAQKFTTNMRYLSNKINCHWIEGGKMWCF